MTIRERFEDIQDKISNSPNPNVTIIAVSKNRSVAEILQARELGLTHFGENYVQEVLPKISEIGSAHGITWHFIGQLQTNKLNKIVPAFQCLHSISQLSQVEKLEKMRAQGITIPKLLLQMNVADEETKSGLSENEMQAFVENISEKTELEIDGLMVFPPYQSYAEDNRVYFAKARAWKEKMAAWGLPRITMRELSMGVSNDYEIAIEEGATMIRLGEALFGPRNS